MSPLKGYKRPKREEPCSECGKTILTACWSRALCPECKAKARAAAVAKYEASDKGKARSLAAAKRYREAHHDELLEKQRAKRAEHREEYNDRRREDYWKNLDHERARSRLRQRIYRGDTKAEWELKKLTGKMQTCPRLHVTALTLPCGQRAECWGGKPCEKCAGMAKPRGLDFGRWEI